MKSLGSGDLRVIQSVIDIEGKRIVQIKHLLPFVKLERAYLPMCRKGERVGECICVICAVMGWGVALLCFARWQMS